MASQTLTERTELLRPTGLSPLLTTDELRAYFNVSNWTVNEWRKKGCPLERIPGGRRRFNLGAVKAWLAQHDAAGAEARAEISRKGVAGRTA